MQLLAVLVAAVTAVTAVSLANGSPLVAVPDGVTPFEIRLPTGNVSVTKVCCLCLASAHHANRACVSHSHLGSGRRCPLLHDKV